MKNKIVKLLILLLLTGISTTLFAQKEQNKSWWEENTLISGYIKYLNTTNFVNLDQLLTNNLIHNRVNFKMFVNQNLTFDLQVRNRVLWGESLKVPGYKDYIDIKNDIDMSLFLIDKPGLLFHSKIDRLSLNYFYKNWEFKIGRQRINWGKSMIWNTNDLFNAYNFLDFDYEERPGSDAISVLYNYGDASAIQAVYSYGKDLNHSIIALRHQFSIKTYDIQLIGANYYTDYAIGLGWEGYISNASFKGESTYFIAKDSESEIENAWLTSISMDYFFKNGLMLIGSILYNNQGITDPDDFNVQYFLSESLSARNLMPNHLSYFIQTAYQVSPATSVNLGAMYMQGFSATALLPSATYSIKNNWDADIFGQLFFGKTEDKFKNINNGVYLRIRWSY